MLSSGSIPKETITIAGGLGPIQAIESPITLDIKPLTVLIGTQGTGKSLISQILYFFHDYEYLLANYFKSLTPNTTVRNILEGIRSGELTNRALASFLTTPKVEISYQKYNLNSPQSDQNITLYQSNRQINPIGKFKKEIDRNLKELFADPSLSGKQSAKSIFIPAERTFFSRFINSDPTILGNRALPITMREFAKVLSNVSDIHQLWDINAQEKPKEALDIENLVKNALRGRAISARTGPYARKWQWIPEETHQPLEIEMASSGQMETWPLVSTAQALSGFPESERPIFIHIEEPETHLHPEAQVAIVKMLAYLVNLGFRLVITTHSLVVLYTLNNLILAHEKLKNKSVDDLPEIKTRIAPEMLSAYLFNQGEIQNIVTDSGKINEGLLGFVLGDLEIQFNQLMTYNLWSK